MRRGRREAFTKRLEEKLRLLAIALLPVGGYANAYNNRGNARFDLRDLQGAIVDFNQAIKINPNSANTYYNRGIARSELRDKQRAITDYN